MLYLEPDVIIKNCSGLKQFKGCLRTVLGMQVADGSLKKTARSCPKYFSTTSIRSCDWDLRSTSSKMMCGMLRRGTKQPPSQQSIAHKCYVHPTHQSIHMCDLFLIMLCSLVKTLDLS